MPDSTLHELPQLATPVRVPLGYAWLVRFATGGGARLRIAALAFALSLPAIGLGFVGDDYGLLAAVRSDPLGAYSFQPRDPAERRAGLLVARDAGLEPWWISLDFHQAFFRPLASLSLAADVAAGGAAWAMHLENNLLFVGIVVLALGIYRRIGPGETAAGLAGFFYATHAGLSMTTGWISGRNTLLAALFGLACIWLHLRVRDGAGFLYRLAAPCALAAALFSAELGLSCLAFITADAVVLDRRRVRTRMLGLVPYLLVVVGWRVFYVTRGYGTAASGFYRDPGQDPLGFGLGLLTGTPIYLASQLTLPFASGAAVSQLGLVVVFALSLVLLAAMAKLWWPLLREDRDARFLFVGAALATLPLGAAPPMDRLGFFVGLGISGLVAKLLEQRFDSRNMRLPRVGARRLFWLHAVWAPLLYVPLMFGTKTAIAGGGAIAFERALPNASAQSVILINAPSHLLTHYVRGIRKREGRPALRSLDLLYAGPSTVAVKRVAERSLELTATRGFLVSTVERFVRDPWREPFRPGDVIDLPRMRATVLEVRAGDPTRVRFDLHESPDGVEPTFYAWQAGGPRTFRLPPLHASLELPRIGAL